MGLTGGYIEFPAAHPQKEIPIIFFSGQADGSFGKQFERRRDCWET